MLAFVLVLRGGSVAGRGLLPNWQRREFWPQTLAILAIVKVLITIETEYSGEVPYYSELRLFLWPFVLIAVFLGLASTSHEAHFTRTAVAFVGVSMLLIETALRYGPLGGASALFGGTALVAVFWVLAPVFRVAGRWLP